MNLRERYQARYGIKQPLRGYQLKAAALGSSLDSYALLMAPRLGKTRIDIAASGYRFLQGQLTRWVIICPSIAKDVWATELRDSLSVPHEVTILDGKSDERKALLKGWGSPGVLSILILNFEATWRLKKLLYKSNPDKVTVDESHRIKNHSTKQSKTITMLGKRATYRTIMTGTFLSAPTDAFSQFKFLDPTIFGTLWKQGRFKKGPTGFLEEYVESFGHGGFKPKTFKNLDQLSQKVSSISYQLTRDQAGGFPQEQYQTLGFELTHPALRHYQEMLKKLKTMVDTSSGSQKVVAEIVLTQVLRLQQITGGFLATEGEPTPIGTDRISALRELIEEYPADTPLVIFCRFIPELHAVVKLTRTMGRSVGTISGDTDYESRNQVKHSFQGGTLDTVVAQIRAGGVAIDLSRADTGIFYSATSSHIDYEQAKARIISRSGGTVSLISLAAKGTIDEDILESLQSKQDLVSKILSRVGLDS